MGLSIDKKPRKSRNGDVYVEIDTGDIFLYDEEVEAWVIAPPALSVPSTPRKPVPFICPQCNGNSYTIKNGIVVCDYCGTMFTEDLEDIIDDSFIGFGRPDPLPTTTSH